MSALIEVSSQLEQHRERVAHDTRLIARMQQIHLQLRAALVSAALAPCVSSDTAFDQLRREINALAQKFLLLSEELMTRGQPATGSAASRSVQSR